MSSQRDNPKRWRPRFSVRMMVIVVTLVCCYAACWGPTKKWGPSRVRSTVNEPDGKRGEFRLATDSEAVAPLIVATNEIHLERLRGYGYVTPTSPPPSTRSYYFWFFGYVAKLPFERDDPEIDLSGASVIMKVSSPQL